MRKQPPSIDEPVPSGTWAGLAVVAAACFLATLDAMVLYVAFADLRRDFWTVSRGTLSWSLSAYTIVVAAGMVGAGRWADRLGRRRVFLLGTETFTLASALCMIAPSPGWLIAARGLQGIGAAALTPTSLALILHAFPKSKVTQAMGIWGAAGALAAVLGPTVGGLIVEAWGWRGVFAVNIPVGIAIAMIGPHLLDESRELDGLPLPDPIGTVLITFGLVLLTLGIMEAEAWGWSSISTLVALTAGALGISAFVARCATVDNPLLGLDLFSEPGFRWANLGQVIFGIGFTIMFFGGVQFLGDVWSYTPVQTGLAMVPGPLTVVLTAPYLGRLAARIGTKRIIIPGGLIYASAVVLLIARLGYVPDYWGLWLPFMVLSGLGVSMVVPLLISAAIAALPPDRLATGSAVNGGLRSLGQTFGVAVFVAAIAHASKGLLEGYRLAWWLVMAAGLATTATALRLPARARTPRCAARLGEVGEYIQDRTYFAKPSRALTAARELRKI